MWLRIDHLPPVVAVVMMVAVPSLAQTGSECSDQRSCFANQVCVLGYCHCHTGFVKEKDQCFPERQLNETCFFDDQCVDFRMKCAPIEPDTSVKRCVCVKYYHWDSASRQCVTLQNLTYMLSDTVEKYDTYGRIEAETKGVFSGLVWAGLGVMVVGFFLAFGCVFYGCCYRRWCRYDKLSPPERRTSKSASCQSCQCQRKGEPSPGRKTATQTTGPVQSPGTQGVVDYVPGLYQQTAFDVI